MMYVLFKFLNWYTNRPQQDGCINRVAVLKGFLKKMTELLFGPE